MGRIPYLFEKGVARQGCFRDVLTRFLRIQSSFENSLVHSLAILSRDDSPKSPD